MTQSKTYSFLQQAFIFATIMLISNLIVSVLPFPMPTSVMGLVLLFIALCLKIVKLEQVEGLGTSLTSLISFLFVPSGISVINSLGIMSQYGIQIVSIILIATIILLAVTGCSASLLLSFRDGKKVSHKALSKQKASLGFGHGKKMGEVK